MNDIKLKKIINEEEIIKIYKQCDCAFEDSICATEKGNAAIKKICQNGDVFAAFHNNEICGYIALYANDRTTNIGFISIFAVMPEFQGKNIGHELLLYVFHYAKSRHMKSVKLEVLNKNHKAIKFYQKHGFNWCNTYDSSESRLMEKHL